MNLEMLLTLVFLILPVALTASVIVDPTAGTENVETQQDFLDEQPEVLTGPPEPWNQNRQFKDSWGPDANIQSPYASHLHGLESDAYDREYRILKELKARDLFHVLVLTEENRLNEFGTAIRLSWGAEVPALHFLFGVSERLKRHPVAEAVHLKNLVGKEMYGIDHIIKSLQYICDEFVNDFHWFVMVKDTTYINVETLLKVLDRLTPSIEIAISLEKEAASCTLDGGLIFSQRLLSTMCPGLSECTSGITSNAGRSHVERRTTDLDLTYCLANIAHIGCTSSNQISDQFHTIVDEPLDHNFYAFTTNLSDDTAFLFPIQRAELIFDIHIHYTEQKLITAEQEIYRLQDELKYSQNGAENNDTGVDGDNKVGKSSADERVPKKQYRSGELDEIAIFDSLHRLINSTDQFYQYIDDTGKMYLDTCKLEKQDLTEEGTMYDLIKQMAVEKVNAEADNMESFAYRFIKPNVGIEYQFFFIEQRQGATKNNLEDKMYQVTLLQAYDKLEIASKDLYQFTTIHIVIPIQGQHDATKIIDQLYTACSSHGHIYFNCNLILIIHKATETQRENDDYLNTLSESVNIKINIIETPENLDNLQKPLHLIDSYIKKDSLVLYIKPFIIPTEDFLQRCILNSLEGKKVYFPVYFQLNEGISPEDILTIDGQYTVSNKYGYWASSDYNVFCAYNRDLHNIEILSRSIQGLVDDFRAQEIDVIRTAEAGLVRQWSPELCSENKQSRHTCISWNRYGNIG